MGAPACLIVQIGTSSYPIAIREEEMPTLFAFLGGLNPDDRRHEYIHRVLAAWAHYKKLPRDPALLPSQFPAK